VTTLETVWSQAPHQLCQSHFLASFHPGGNPALQSAPAGLSSGSFQNVSGRRIVIQREQKCKAIWVCAETMLIF
jgi:hypothetical protein